jgi:hypothetical protein
MMSVVFLWRDVCIIVASNPARMVRGLASDDWRVALILRMREGSDASAHEYIGGLYTPIVQSRLSLSGAQCDRTDCRHLKHCQVQAEIVMSRDRHVNDHQYCI